MEKKQIEIGITVTLVIVFIFALFNSIRAVGKKTKAKPAAAAVTVKNIPISQQSAGKSAKIIPLVSGQYIEEAEWGRDPFSGRMYSSEKKASALRLIGIIWDEKEPLAMINERILKVGDMIQGKQIIRINSDSIVVDDGSKEIELKLQQ